MLPRKQIGETSHFKISRTISPVERTTNVLSTQMVMQPSGGANDEGNVSRFLNQTYEDDEYSNN